MPQAIGIFDSAPLANEAITRLLSAGLTKDDISLVMSDKAKKNFSAATKDTGDRTLVDSAIGASTGGILGALLAGLTAAGAIVIPGAQLLIVGPLIAAIAGGGAGAAVGSVIGAFSALGVSAAESAKYAGEINAGKAVIIAHTKNDQQTLAANAVLTNSGAKSKAA